MKLKEAKFTVSCSQCRKQYAPSKQKAIEFLDANELYMKGKISDLPVMLCPECDKEKVEFT